MPQVIGCKVSVLQVVGYEVSVLQVAETGEMSIQVEMRESNIVVM